MDGTPLVILGSARRDGDTEKAVTKLFGTKHRKVLSLLDFSILPYTYEGNYPDDDNFLDLINHVLAHENIVFATPVYWYAMSGSMKVFFDRLTDLITVKKILGRQLKGKKIFLIAVGSDEQLPEGFEVPFRLTAAYFEMDFVSSIYLAKGSLASRTKQEEEEIFVEQVFTFNTGITV